MPIDFSSLDPKAALANPAVPATAARTPAAAMDAFQEQDPRPPVYAWVLPIAGLAGLVGIFLPWFHGYATNPDGHTVNFHGTISSWDDGRIGLLPGVLLAVMGFVALILLLRPARRRHDAFDTGPVFKAARRAAIAGGVSLICLLVAYLLVPHEYRFGGESWSSALAEARYRLGSGVQFHRGPEIGFWLTLGAAAVAAATGLVLMVRLRAGGDTRRDDGSKVSEDGWALPADARRADD